MFCWVNVVIFICLYVDDTVIYTNNKTNHLNQIVLSSKKYIVALKVTLLFHGALLFPHYMENIPTWKHHVTSKEQFHLKNIIKASLFLFFYTCARKPVC